MNKKPEVKNIIILGPQGAGKGTQAQLLAKRKKLYHFEVGIMLRKIAKENTPLGRKVDAIINKRGQLVPYELVAELSKKVVSSVPKNKSIIFDGTPRREEEIKPFEQILKQCGRRLTDVIFVDISKKESIKRLSVRGREDDTPKAIQKRLSLYEEKTKKAIDYYKEKNIFTRINGEQTVEEVYKDIEQAIWSRSRQRKK